ncbi:nucleotidyl transferase AbiEii/AbiGii toxin family protein [Nocardia sp. NPDC059240]|uniref:nucleotidyl transferase AbiEii/AbiGii toxin family protein n=1 Tax=Nocardia sp. NPDC059240 TaxID=3346786 RepID=UPI003690680E
MTSTPWRGLGRGPWKSTAVAPQSPPTEQERADNGLPPTLRPVPGEGVLQRPVFDPALAEHRMGMRLSEPHFEDARLAAAWSAARRTAMSVVLAAIADSPWHDELMLRGSVLLRAWFGDVAREPGDVDFIVLPQDWEFHSDRTDAFLADIAARVAAAADGSPTVRIRAEDAVDDDIWTYDRVPGRRLVLPWTAVDPHIPSGTVQLDFVFNEAPQQPPRWTDIPLAGTDGPAARLLAATPELSLAWKLLWLSEDRYPEGKDLYDAVLLAERCRPAPELLATVSPEAWFARLPALGLDAEWEEFVKDRPDLADQVDSLAWRLTVALAPAYPQDQHSFCGEVDRWVAGTRARADNSRDIPQDLPVEDRIERVSGSLTVYRLLAVRDAYDCSLSRAADRILAARLRNSDVPGIAARVDPHAVAEVLQRWCDSPKGE